MRPGGLFLTVVEGPDGTRMSHAGCYLEVVENRRLVWTSALTAGYRPQPLSGGGLPFHFTGFLDLEPTPTGTKYTAMAIQRRA